MKRISLVVLILCACFVSVAWGQQPANKCTNNWSEFHRTNMRRWNPCEKVLGVNNVGKLRLKWTYTTGNSVFSSPAVANGVVYVGSEDRNVYALNAKTGAKLWNYTTGGFVYSSPAVANGVVYVGSEDGYVYALTASTGALLWSSQTRGAVESSPAVVNGVVYVGSDKMYALNAKTGAKLWSYATDSPVFSSPAVANGAVYVGSDNMYALNAKTGAKMWSSTEGGGDSSPAVANGSVYVGQDNVYALTASTGTLLWTYNAFYGLISLPAVAQGVAYVDTEDPLRVRAERQHWRRAVELRDRRRGFLARGGEWRGLCRLVPRYRVRAEL
jgi:outer membrane protein assembly factor BamB